MEAAAPALKEAVLEALRAHRPALDAEGVEHLSIFGSIARGESTRSSDIDICVELRPEARPRGFAQVRQIETLRERLRSILGRRVDLVVSPVHKPRLREEIERDGVRAF